MVMSSPSCAFLLVLLPIFFIVQADYTHNQFRQYTCMSPQYSTEDAGENATLCELLTMRDGDWVIMDEEDEKLTGSPEGCFMEREQVRGQMREYCPLHCVDAVSAYVDEKRPNNNRFCVSFFSYNVIRRNDDYYLWRSGECLRQEIQFEIGCTFPFKQRKPTNKPVKKPALSAPSS